MNRRRTSTPKQLPVAAYMIISIVSFIVTVLCIYYYLHYIQGSVTQQVSDKMFYLILILFGISASALIFGAMNSYGRLSGKQFDTRYHFTGPVVGVILVVLGGFYIPHDASRQTISVQVTNEKNLPVTNGHITLYFSHYTRDQIIDEKGMAVFTDIDNNELTQKVKFDIVSDGYSRRTFDTLITAEAPILVQLPVIKSIHLAGTVVTAEEMPITNVVVSVDGTRFYGTTITNGSFSFNLADYSIGDEIDLVTSHPQYEDKTTHLKIDKQDMSDIHLVLQKLN